MKHKRQSAIVNESYNTNTNHDEANNVYSGTSQSMEYLGGGG